MNVADVVDAALEAPVVPSFTRIGYEIRRRLDHWEPLSSYDIGGRVILLTGATSGLGRAAAVGLAGEGATVLIVGRDPARNESARTGIVAETGNDRVEAFAADLGDKSQVRELARAVLDGHGRLDVLIHNAGALDPQRSTAPDGTEATIASQVVGPFLLTALLLERLGASSPSRVLTMSSGGMYTAGLTVANLEMSEDDYRGTEQYARAKRAQVTLNEMWAQRFGHLGIHFHALHPGWADTPGVDASLPTFSKVVGPLLRPPEQGADTLVWLAAADDEPLESNGGFWHDRRRRSIHRLGRTRRTDTEARREELWSWVCDRAGVDPEATA